MGMTVTSTVSGFDNPGVFDKVDPMVLAYEIENAELEAERQAKLKNRNIMEKLKAFITGKPLLAAGIFIFVGVVAAKFLGNKIGGGKKW